jgi:hypothetical protein
MEIEQEKERTIPVTPLASGVVLVIGVGLVYVGRKDA